jgi:hypothetical protein
MSSEQKKALLIGLLREHVADLRARCGLVNELFPEEKPDEYENASPQLVARAAAFYAAARAGDIKNRMEKLHVALAKLDDQLSTTEDLSTGDLVSSLQALGSLTQEMVAVRSWAEDTQRKLAQSFVECN